jgi:hypothetical protein
MPKEQKSKLDQYAETLLVMEESGKTLDRMVEWLREEGLTIDASTVSRYLAKLRQQRAQESLLSSIVSGADQCRRVESEFARNPAPELETLVKLHRVLILNMTTQAARDPKEFAPLLSLANSMTATVMEMLSGQTKAAFKEREVSLAERKAAEARKSDQEKALEVCLEEARAFPAVQKMFRDSFAALKAAGVDTVAK